MKGSLIDGLPNITTTVPEGDLEEMKKWGEQQSRLMADNPLIHGLPPHEKQLDVHKATHDEVMLVAANRWGKSFCGMRETLLRATGLHPYKKIRKHKTIWCGFVDFGFYLRTTRPTFDKLCPVNHLIQFHESEKWAKFKRVDGGTCTVHFLSYESDRKSWQGSAVDFIWLDEELPEEIYKEASARLIDSRGQMLLTQTPVSGLGWAYDRIYLPARAGVKDSLIVQGGLAEKDETKPFGVGKILVPHMDYDQVLRFAKVITDADERAIRVFGEFRGRSGGVFKMYDPQVHVVPPFKVPRYFEVWGGLDPGYHGFAATMLAMDPKGRIYVADEFFSQEENHTKRVGQLWEKVQNTFHLDEDDYFIFYCDTANPQDILELNTWAQQVGARIAFTSLEHGKKAKITGIQRVQEYLTLVEGRSVPDHVARAPSTRGEPMMYFFDNLRSEWTDSEEGLRGSRLLWEMQRLLWKRARKDQSDPNDTDDSSASGAHALDSLRYAMMARMSSPEAPKESDRRGLDPILRKHMEEIEERERIFRGEDVATTNDEPEESWLPESE